jgi:farnesyl-diphosphate farnesyltransferase
MLTELFCDYSEEIAKNRAPMLTLAASCGQGLQMTNILKDIWEDRSRNVCWLPKDVFRQYGFDLKNLSKDGYQESFGKGLTELIGVTNTHLHNALTYTLLIPKHEQGIRRFCFWAFNMALLTLRKINSNPAFTSGRRVTISRRTLKTAIFFSNLSLVSDRLTRALFALSSIGLPRSTAPCEPPNGSPHRRLAS